MPETLSYQIDLNSPNGADVRHLVPISKAAERAKISSEEIVHLILGRNLKTVVCKSGDTGIASIFVDSDEFKSVAGDLLVGHSISSAAGRLKMPRRSVLKLAGEHPDAFPSQIVKP